METSTYHKRKIYPVLHENLANKKILILTGSRQVGKTTLMRILQQSLPSDTKTLFIDMDIVSNREIGETLENFLDLLYLNGYVENGPTFYCFVDEFHKVRDIGTVFKNLYDNYSNVKIIASGSSSLLIKNTVKESLAGRKHIFPIYPLDFEEYLQFKNDSKTLEQYKNIEKLKQSDMQLPVGIEKHIQEFLTFGGYPEVVLAKDEQNKKMVLASIFDLYLEKDIVNFSNIENFSAFKKLVELLAVRHGKELSVSTLAKETSLHTKTVKHYLFLLEETYIIRLVRPFHSNKKKEITKSPKVYFMDNGVRNFFLKNYSPPSNRPDKGALWEGYVLQEYAKNMPDIPISFWRTKQKQEVDFVLGGALMVPIEVKYTSTGTAREYGNMRTFMRTYDLQKGIVLSMNGNHTITKEDVSIQYLPAINFVDRVKVA